MIVVAGLTEHVDHAVDRRRTADHFAARKVQASPIEARLRLSLEQPVGARIADRKQITDRNVKPDPIVAPARLKQQYAICRISGQAVREYATRRARANDDVVELAFHGGHDRNQPLSISLNGLYPGRRDLLDSPSGSAPCVRCRGRNGGSDTVPDCDLLSRMLAPVGSLQENR